MSRKYKFRNPDSLYFISYATVYWLDVFIRKEYKEILIESWNYCQKFKGLVVHAWVIMTSHVHMIISTRENKLENIVRDMKSYTAKEIYEAIITNPLESRKDWLLSMMRKAAEKNCNNVNFQFWQQHNKPIELFNNKMIDQKLDYLHNNPVVEGIVDYPENYLYSSARDYYGERGLLNVEIIT